MNLAIQILASYPPSGKEKGYEAQPSGGVSAHYLLGREDTSAEDKKEYLDILSRQSGRLKKLIQDLIDASKASSGAIQGFDGR